MTRLLFLLATVVLVAAALYVGAPAPAEAAIPPNDFILCSCKLCAAEPYTVCQISPSGYSILCADWYRLHC
jgi:hypothetical protein